MTNFPILKSSPMAQVMDGRKIGTEKYPWRSLEVGNSYKIPIDGSVKFTTINNSCYKWSKKLNCIFRAFQHDDCIEVARIK